MMSIRGTICYKIFMYMIFSIICIVYVVSLTGCSKKAFSKEKIKDLDFTVLEQSEIPAKLAEEIASKKEEGFKITYIDGEYMYIAVGYGAQETGGYSVVIKELYQTKDAICINSGLIGPRENDLVLKAKTYPYIVIKLEKRDMDVVFN